MWQAFRGKFQIAKPRADIKELQNRICISTPLSASIRPLAQEIDAFIGYCLLKSTLYKSWEKKKIENGSFST